MKISTKFLGFSVVLVGAITIISGGSTLWRNQVEQSSLIKYNQAKRRIELSIQAQYQIQREIDLLKDFVLIEKDTEDKILDFGQKRFVRESLSRTKYPDTINHLGYFYN